MDIDLIRQKYKIDLQYSKIIQNDDNFERLNIDDFHEKLLNPFNYLPHLLGVFKSDGSTLFLNREWLEMVGNIDNFFRIISMDDLQDLVEQLIQLPNSQQKILKEVQLFDIAEKNHWYFIQVKIYFDDVSTKKVILISAINIHNRKTKHLNFTHQFSSYKNMLDISADCIKLLDKDGTLLYVNKNGRKLLGLPPEDGATVFNWFDLVPLAFKSRCRNALKLAFSGKNSFAKMETPEEGSVKFWNIRFTPIVDDNNQTQSVLCISRDITHQINTKKQLQNYSELDQLTGLYNRKIFKNQLKKLLDSAKDQAQQVGLILLGLDYFKHINEMLGHAAGDHLLRVLSKRLITTLTDKVFIARVGGDEFAVAVNNLENENELYAIAETVAKQLETPISYDGKRINGGMSIGCAIYPHHALDVNGLMRCVDTALHDIKNDGRGGIRFYDEHMLFLSDQTAKQLHQARNIIQKNWIVPYYQPKVHLLSQKIVGFEALLRWISPSEGLSFPSVLQEAFKDYQLATKISSIMQTKIFADISSWLKQGVDVVPIAINAAPVEFLRDDYAEKFLLRLEKYKIPAHLIEVEVTEQVLSERSANYVLRALRLLKSKGVKISLDDFGTGHSSLSRLKDYPIDCLKIDRSFIQLIEPDKETLAIVQAIIQLAPKLQLDIIAEGIEKHSELEILIKSGCKIGQGFLFSKAIEANQVVNKLMC
ncbi:EAL domain-containing protein [Acinetobacter gerneri]|uniref:EAL domain-containing protein n=1 Tax=Acinetobacter gerneri TaxID=202952 RepID=UPI00293648CC|nr:EAL domain-containing protein [Acinetobacter gerneri]MDV2441506.1 EAL domain-containing protein [Acinetobacter gerneri]